MGWKVGAAGVGKKAWRGGVVLALLSIGMAAFPITSEAAPNTVNIAILNESSGAFGQQFGPFVPGAQAWVKWTNAHGGINGHKISATVYDNASNPTTSVANSHLAVERGAVAFLDTDPLFDGSAPYLKSVGMPVYAFGITPGFYGASAPTFFSYTGDITTGRTTTTDAFYINKYKRTKFAVISDPSPADSGDSKAGVPIITALGGQIVYQNYNVDPTNTAALLAVAQAIKASGAQVVNSAAGGTEAQFQADLAQVGASNIWVSNGSNFQENLPKQFGSALNNYTFFFFTAPFTVPTAGMHDYLSEMAKTDPADEYNFQSLVGWASAALMGGGIAKVGSKAVTRSSLANGTNELKNYTGDGVFAPVTFPAFHTQPTSCLSFVQVQNGKWVQISGTKTSPFFCSPPTS